MTLRSRSPSVATPHLQSSQVHELHEHLGLLQVFVIVVGNRVPRCDKWVSSDFRGFQNIRISMNAMAMHMTSWLRSSNHGLVARVSKAPIGA